MTFKSFFFSSLFKEEKGVAPWAKNEKAPGKHCKTLLLGTYY